MSHPVIMTPEVQLAFDSLVKAMQDAADQQGHPLLGVAVSWAVEIDDQTGFNCLFTDGVTAEIAECMAGVLIDDADELDFETELPKVTRQ